MKRDKIVVAPGPHHFMRVDETGGNCGESSPALKP